MESKRKYKKTNKETAGFCVNVKLPLDIPRRELRPRKTAEQVKAEIEIKDEISKNSFWQPEEKLKLLEAIKKHGCSDFEKLAKEVKTRNVNDVKYFLEKNMQRIRVLHYRKLCHEYINELKSQGETARAESFENEALRGRSHTRTKEMMNAVPPIELWKLIAVNSTKPEHRATDYSHALVDLLKRFGEDEEECDDPDMPDFKAMYKFIEDSLTGCVSSDLSPINSVIILEIMDKLSNFITVGLGDEEIKFVQEYMGPTQFMPEAAALGETGCTSAMPSTAPTNKIIPEASTGKRKKSAKKIATDGIPIPDELYDHFHRHMKIRENLNPFGVPPFMLLDEQRRLANWMKELGWEDDDLST